MKNIFNIGRNILTGIPLLLTGLILMWLSKSKQYHCEYYPDCNYPANKQGGLCARHQAIEDNFTYDNDDPHYYDDSERELHAGPGGNAPTLNEMSYQ
jgi:hypothetical protein